MRVAGVVVDQSPLKQVYDPKHPMADAQGYISMPNVDPIAETVKMCIRDRSSACPGRPSQSVRLTKWCRCRQ